MGSRRGCSGRYAALLSLLCALGGATSATAEPDVAVPGLAITRHVVAGGGGACSGGRFTLVGTMGQPEASRALSGVTSLTGGFWGGNAAWLTSPVLEDPFALTLPVAPRLYANAPNPFNPRTTITFDLPVAAHARLEIFNVRGERVRRLVDGALPAGRSQVVWDGRLDDGGDAASGLYLVSLEAGGHRLQGKMMLVR